MAETPTEPQKPGDNTDGAGSGREIIPVAAAAFVGALIGAVVGSQLG